MELNWKKLKETHQEMISLLKKAQENKVNSVFIINIVENMNLLVHNLLITPDKEIREATFNEILSELQYTNSKLDRVITQKIQEKLFNTALKQLIPHI